MWKVNELWVKIDLTKVAHFVKLEVRLVVSSVFSAKYFLLSCLIHIKVNIFARVIIILILSICQKYFQNQQLLLCKI